MPYFIMSRMNSVTVWRHGKKVGGGRQRASDAPSSQPSPPPRVRGGPPLHVPGCVLPGGALRPHGGPSERLRNRVRLGRLPPPLQPLDDVVAEDGPAIYLGTG